MTDFILFLRRFVSQPNQVGSVIPSSRFLSKRMMEAVQWDEARAIVELGPGTGVFTKDILQKKRPDATFFVIERDAEFQEILRSRFPGLIVEDEAQKLRDYLQEQGLAKVDAIVSSLPFAVFPEQLRNEILQAIIDSLDDDGVFVTYQYSLQMKGMLSSLFEQVEVGFTPFNIPPAFVYTCRKHAKPK
ncbi:UNVERIFIED_CONTAM: phospholipid N-methyltransferase [Brevibacillus sp. OAP136]